jgi:excisionase family DNA binding protein
MNKEEAAKFLDVSVRTLQRLTADGIFKTITSGKKGAVVYDRDELRQWRDMPEDERQKVREEAAARKGGTSLSPMTVMTENRVMTRNVGVTVTRDNLREHAALVGGILEYMPPPVPLHEKLRLTIDEAVRYSGLSKGEIEGAIKSKKLKAEKRGPRRSWIIKREDLLAYNKKH